MPTDLPGHHDFYWSARTLRVDIRISDCEVETQDVLQVDQHRCIIAREPYGEAIVEALNARFGSGEDEIKRLRGVLLHITQLHELCNELYTSHEDCAWAMAAHARKALGDE